MRRRELREFEERIRQRDLAEKRRVAPGWLDSDARILEPERAGTQSADAVQPQADVGATHDKENQEPAVDQGAELDRAFGGMALK